MMRKIFGAIWFLLKWVIVLVIGVEVISFIVISASNFILYGNPREGGRAVYDAYTLFLQDSGVRKTEYNSRSENPEKNVAVWMFGGSTMRGPTPLDDKTLPSQLAKILNSRPGALRFTITNYGMDSFNSLLETKYLQKLLIENPEKPNIIIFYDGANDAKYFAEYRTPYGHYGYRRVKALIESYRKSRLGFLKPLNAAIFSSFTKELYDKIHQVEVPLEPDAPGMKQLAVLTEERYDYVDKVARCYGADFFLFWQPSQWVERCDIPESVREKEKGLIVNSGRFATVRKNLTLPYLAIKGRLKDKPYFIDFQNALCDRTIPAYTPDGVHLRPDGDAMVAEKMASALLKRFSK